MLLIVVCLCVGVLGVEESSSVPSTVESTTAEELRTPVMRDATTENVSAATTTIAENSTQVDEMSAQDAWEELCLACKDTVKRIEGLFAAGQQPLRAPAIHMCEMALKVMGFELSPIPGTRLICETALFSQFSPFQRMLNAFGDEAKAQEFVRTTCSSLHACHE